MKIALDLRRIKNPGIGRYMRCLTEALLRASSEHEYLLILAPEGFDEFELPGAAVEKIACSAKYYSLSEQVALPWLLRNHKVDLLHSPHFTMPVFSPCPVVVTMHDVIYLACPEDLPSRLGRLYYRGMMTAAARLASRIITDSEFSRDDILRRLNANPGKLEVIHCGIEPRFRPVTDAAQMRAVCSAYGIKDDFILYTGIFRPRKNHADLLRAFRVLLARELQAQMVFAGPGNGDELSTKRLAQELGIAEHVVFTGFVRDADMPALYSAARVYACPSLYEGFGFTVLEAMACGTPVVCSGATSLREVAGDAALYANPRHAEEFACALKQVFDDPATRSEMIEKGLRNSRRFRWEQAAEATLAVYHRALALPAKQTAFA